MNKYIKYLLQVFILIMISCSAKNTKVNENIDSTKNQNNHLDIENQIIWSVLQTKFRRNSVDTIFDKSGKIINIYKHEKPPKPEILVINETVGIHYDSSDSTYQSLKGMGLTMLSTTMLNDFCNRNKSSITVGPFYGFDGNISYASLAENERIISEEIGGQQLGPVISENDGFDVLRTTIKEHVYFSRPGFNNDRTLAIIEFSTYSGPLSSAEFLLILGKVNGKWKILESILTMIS